MAPYISVIIPVYGVQEWAERCVSSIMQQTIKDGVEFIFVDDASTDNSLNIVRDTVCRYPDRIHSVKIISHTHNMGLPEVM